MGAAADPIRVLLVEDNDVFRQALELLFELQDGSRSSARSPRETPRSVRAGSSRRTSS